MNRRFTIFLFLLFFTNAISCITVSKGGKLFISDETHPGTEIFTIKILQHSCNQNSVNNGIDEYCEIIKYKGYHWYVFDIPNGTWDIYLEYYDDGDYRNEREEVNIKSDHSDQAWAAIWLVNNNHYSVWTEQGRGNLNITNALFEKL